MVAGSCIRSSRKVRNASFALIVVADCSRNHAQQSPQLKSERLNFILTLTKLIQRGLAVGKQLQFRQFAFNFIC